MILMPLEFTDCLADSPFFRENLHAHERELEVTNNQIKGLVKQVKELLEAAKGKHVALPLPLLTLSPRSPVPRATQPRIHPQQLHLQLHWHGADRRRDGHR